MRFAKIILALAIILVLFTPLTTARTVTVPLGQVIPPIITTSSNVRPSCGILILSPGSAIADTSGFITANCPNNAPAVSIGGTETPSFVAPAGILVVLMFYSQRCSFNFLPPNTRLVGLNMTSGTPIAFTPATNSTTQLAEGGYNYCLFYQTPPSSGFAGFTISWTP